MEITAKPGQSIKLDATGSTDIDNNTLSYEWKFYPEAGTYKGQIDIENANNITSSFVVPEDASGTALHILLVLTDNGTPPLVSYQRIVCNIREN